MSPAISVQQLSKRFRLGEYVGKQSFREALTGVFRQHRKKEAETLWALQDVSFDVAQGEVLGVIGRNGAGKSTLLKVLTGITEPTSGRVELNGRVASLLEVGTGFHGELTGRENVFLNGSILGMSRAEIKSKFDEIVAFSGVEKFLDTPVKRYSSGMYMRLAFSVAAHLEQEILLVDEVLAVGDAEFQKKCLGKMGEVANAGRTVLFVSHNMGAVSTLCPETVLLQDGRLDYRGPSAEAIARYLRAGASVDNHVLIPRRDNRVVHIRQLDLADPAGTPTAQFSLRENALLEIRVDVDAPVDDFYLQVTLSRDNMTLLRSHSCDSSGQLGDPIPSGEHTFGVELPLRHLKAGRYVLSVVAAQGHTADPDERAQMLVDIIDAAENTTHLSYRSDRPGFLVGPLVWTKPSAEVRK